MRLETRSFGTLEFEPEAVIEIGEGLLGFSQYKRYLLIENPEIHPFKWLQSIDDELIGFPVVDPHLVLKPYTCAVTLEDLRGLGIERETDALTLVIAVIPEDPSQTTVNLKAPLIINHRKMLGKQVILMNSSYETNQPVAG